MCSEVVLRIPNALHDKFSSETLHLGTTGLTLRHRLSDPRDKGGLQADENAAIRGLGLQLIREGAKPQPLTADQLDLTYAGRFSKYKQDCLDLGLRV